jgi:GR25 family glycosyltransferase involved in LPS biosynthesis
MILDYFEEAVYINLESRPDRKARIEERLKREGIKARRYNAAVIDPSFPRLESLVGGTSVIDPRRLGQIGCSKSHFDVVKYAKDNKLKNILIFEDDCIFVEGFRKKALTAVRELQNARYGEFDKHHRKGMPIQWDVLYFGGEPMSRYVSISDNLSQVGGYYCLHAYAVNSCYYDQILDGPNAFNIYKEPAMDMWYVHRDPRSRRFIMTTELLAYQEDGLDGDNDSGKVRQTFQRKYNEFK